MTEASTKPEQEPDSTQDKPHPPEKRGAITTSAPASPEEKAAEKGGG